MEGLTRLVSESLARHGFDRPLDYRRLRWSQWFRCESHHSLLLVPSKPGVFALAEEILDFAAHGATGASPVPRSSCGADASSVTRSERSEQSRRLLAVSQFFDTDDMAFTLDRMLTRNNPLRARLESGHYFIRFVVVDEESQRRSIATALNQWIANSTEKATGIAAHFATSLEITQENVGRTLLSVNAGTATNSEQNTQAETKPSPTSPQPDPGAATNIHRPPVFPSGF